jgi:RNA polymerase sigma-70 factor (ECF subfamily)
VTDQELVERARGGDPSAFEELVGRHHRAALRAALAALGSTEEADDVAQDAWIAAHARLNDFRQEASFRTWLLTIVWNKALDRRRRLGRALRRLVSLDQGWDDPEGASARGTAGQLSHAGGGHPGATGYGGQTAASYGTASGLAVSPEQRVLHGDFQLRVRRLVRSLPAKLRDPLLLMGSGEHRYEDVAALLGVPTGTVKWRVAEARRLLKSKLERLGY